MGRKLSGFEKELYQRTDEVMHYVWDPIGISGIPQARDEYDAYLPSVFAMLVERKTEGEIAAYLASVEQGRMGLTPDSESASRVASILTDWRDTLSEKFQSEE